MKPVPDRVAKPTVTDHAVLRYLERVKGFDVESVRKQIAERCAPYVAGGLTALHADGVKYEFHKGVVVTVAPACSTPSRTKIKMVQGIRV